MDPCELINRVRQLIVDAGPAASTDWIADARTLLSHANAFSVRQWPKRHDPDSISKSGQRWSHRAFALTYMSELQDRLKAIEERAK